MPNNATALFQRKCLWARATKMLAKHFMTKLSDILLMSGIQSTRPQAWICHVIDGELL